MVLEASKEQQKPESLGKLAERAQLVEGISVCLLGAFLHEGLLGQGTPALHFGL